MQDTGSNGTVAAGSSAFRYGIAKISNFARIAKISNFAISCEFLLASEMSLFLAKLCIFATHINFAKLAKFR